MLPLKKLKKSQACPLMFEIKNKYRELKILEQWQIWAKFFFLLKNSDQH